MGNVAFFINQLFMTPVSAGNQISLFIKENGFGALGRLVNAQDVRASHFTVPMRLHVRIVIFQ